MQLQPDTLLQGRYRVVGLIARGGMGAVYRAVDERLGNTVDIKQPLMADPALRAAFEREARLLAGLQHPALPVVSDHFAEAGGQFLVMQFIPGDDVATLLHARGGPFPPATVLAWADELLDPAPEGHEYFLVQVALEATGDANLADLYPRLAGEHRVLYATSGVPPVDLPDALARGERVEAWLPYIVAAGEADLVLFMDTVSSEPDYVPLFLAADEGARLALDPSIAAIVPDSRGVSHREPALVGEPATMEDYIVTVLDTQRGPAVLDALVENYARAERPRPGYEYALVAHQATWLGIEGGVSGRALPSPALLWPNSSAVSALVRVRVRYIGDGGAVGWAHPAPGDFASVSAAAADPEAETIGHPSVYVLPDELLELDANLLPGGEYEGWTVIELPVDADDMVLVFSAGYDPNGLNTRYFALE